MSAVQQDCYDAAIVQGGGEDTRKAEKAFESRRLSGISVKGAEAFPPSSNRGNVVAAAVSYPAARETTTFTAAATSTVLKKNDTTEWSVVSLRMALRVMSTSEVWAVMPMTSAK